MNDDKLPNEEARVDFLNSPEGGSEGPQNFSMRVQQQRFRDKFLGGSSNGPDKQRERSSKRLNVFEISRFDIKKPTVEGLEKIPPQPCVIATTHLSDIDVQEVALAVADQRRVGVASQETNLTFAPFVPFVKAIGKENFFPVTNSYSKGHAGYSLRMEDLDKMEEGIKQDRRTMIVAAHNPTHNWALAEHPGMAAVILAHKANVPLVPAALDIDSKTPVAQSTDMVTRVKNFATLNRPGAKITFGDPVNLAEISEEKLRAAVGLYSPDQRRNMTPEQINEAQETLTILQNESEAMMKSLASKLPPEKRGKWGTTPTEQSESTI